MYIKYSSFSEQVCVRENAEKLRLVQENSRKQGTKFNLTRYFDNSVISWHMGHLCIFHVYIEKF